MKNWCLLFLSLTVPAAGASTTALDCLERIRAKFGDKALAGIVEVTGTKGQPQPEDWWLLSYDPKGPFKLHYYWADSTRVSDEGFDDDVYRKGAPDGFLRFDKIKLDSPDVFRLANAEAQRVVIDFDRIDYRLHCRPFSDEPLWTVRLYNRSQYVGKLDFSAGDGSLLRSVWLKYTGNGRRGGAVRVSDSAFPSGAPPEIAGNTVPVIPGSGLTEPQLDPGLTPPDRGADPSFPDPPGGESPAPEKYPTAILIEGRPGYVRSPFQPEAGLVDVRGLDPGTPAHCPYTGKIFLVP